MPAERTQPVLFVDADACPVKAEVYRVAERHGLDVVLVANSFMATPRGDHRIRLQVVPQGPDVADDWIVEAAAEHDVVVTADIPLAARCLAKGAAAVGPTGRPFTQASIGAALASRELMSHLREIGEITGGPAVFQPKDRSRFLQELEHAVVRAKRAIDAERTSA
ncbi:YaiI/YqxD family protein [Hansschlegelia plantiphila]|uniref:UPF0178 protein GCM10008179_24030 n=1 Tax=Hansschlegelia plantiphila TaxID=374655 RepID=A0A9W6J3T1_9HYPH|nr:YaiI/YqxD family protein [Hansschlegelia plantiphila]GLK68765.1 UPF0178 protein [Hansschlegelia plantiphila]